MVMILNVRECVLNPTTSRYGPVEGSYAYGNNYSGSIKEHSFQLNDYQLLKKDHAALIYFLP
jgi:hypothetical protein